MELAKIIFNRPVPSWDFIYWCVMMTFVIIDARYYLISVIYTLFSTYHGWLNCSIYTPGTLIAVVCGWIICLFPGRTRFVVLIMFCMLSDIISVLFTPVFTPQGQIDDKTNFMSLKKNIVTLVVMILTTYLI